MITKPSVQERIDNLQHQLDTMQRGDAAFKGYVHRQLESISQGMEGMATKEDLRNMETRLVRETNQALGKTNKTVEELGEKVKRMDGTLAKIAEKLGV